MFLIQKVYVGNLIKDIFRISTATAYYMADHNFHKSTMNTEYKRRANDDFYQHSLGLQSASE